MGMGSFVVIVPAKKLEPCQNGMMRATHDLELQQHFAGVDWGGKSFDMHFLPGGGLAVEAEDESRCTSVAIKDAAMAVFNGSLTNHTYLIKRYCQTEAEAKDGCEAVAVSDRALTASQPPRKQKVSEAEVVLTMYQQLGTTMLPKLRGNFSFCIYDSKTVRVLAARDPHGNVELAQARAADGSLVVASGRFLPKDCSRLEEVPPGHFKYGWSAPIQRYAHNAEQTREVVAAAAAAAARALEGSPPVLQRAPSTPPTTTRHASISVPDSESGSENGSSRLRTRRGKRAGRHQRRSSLEASGVVMDGLPARTPSAAEGHPRPSRFSLDSQQMSCRAADKAAWWRHDARPQPPTPAWRRQRQSIDCGSVSHAMSAATTTKLSPLAPIFEPAGSSGHRNLADHSRGEEGQAEASSDTAHSSQTMGPLSAADASKAAAAAFGVEIPQPTGQTHAHDAENMSSSPRQPSTTDMSDASETVSAASLVADALKLERQQQQQTIRCGMPRDSAVAAPSQQAMEPLPAGLAETLAGPYRDDGASLHMLANLLLHSPCSVCITDARQPDCPIVHVNSAFEAATGYSASEVVGRNCRFLQAPPDQPIPQSAAAAAMRTALDAGCAKGVRLLNYRKDGTPIHNDLTVVPLRRADRTVTHFVGMQTFSALTGENYSPQCSTLNGSPRAVQHQGGLTGLPEKSRSCMELASLTPADTETPHTVT